MILGLVLTVLLTFNTAYDIALEESQRPVITRIPVTIIEKPVIQEHHDDMDFLAQIIMAEAEGEDLIGMRLVGDVILNRVDHPSFPDTIREVVYAPGQFEPMWTGRFEEVGDRISEQAYEAARLCLEERLDDEILYFATWQANGEGFWQHGNHWFSY